VRFWQSWPFRVIAWLAEQHVPKDRGFGQFHGLAPEDSQMKRASERGPEDLGHAEREANQDAFDRQRPRP